MRCSAPGATVRAEIAASLLRQKFAIFGGIAPVQPARPRRESSVAQLDNVHSVLRLNYETLRGLISLASLSIAKPTLYETCRGSAPWRRAGEIGGGKKEICGPVRVVHDDEEAFCEGRDAV